MPNPQPSNETDPDAAPAPPAPAGSAESAGSAGSAEAPPEQAGRSAASGRSGRAARLPPDERRAAIVAATVPLIREHGFAVNTRQIAEAAGVAEGTLFRVFPTKRALVDAAIEHALDPMSGVRKLDAIDRSAPLAERVEAAIEIFRQGMRSTWRLFAVLRATRPEGEQPERPPGSGPEAWELVTEALTRVMEPDRDRLSVPPDRAARFLGAMVFAAGKPPGAKTEFTEIPTPELVDVLLYGLLGDLRTADRDHTSSDGRSSC